MTYTLTDIYRVVCEQNYQQTTPETYWTTSKEECEHYIENSKYKHCLHIEKSRISDKVVKINI